jgi:hypothetical protein
LGQLTYRFGKPRACNRARLSVVPISASNIDLAPIRRTLQSKMRL